MEINSLIEQLAFGRTVPKPASCLGLYLHPAVIFLSEVRVKGSKPVVEHLLKIPGPTPSYSTQTQTRSLGNLNVDMLDAERIAGLLKQVMGQAQWNSRHLVVVLSHHFGLFRYFTMPGIDRRFWKTAIPMEAKKHIPIQMADLAQSYQIVPLPSGPDRRPRQGVLFGFTHRKIIEVLREIAVKLQVNLIGVEASPCSVGRLWHFLGAPGAAGEGPASLAAAPMRAEVFVEGATVRVLLSCAGIPVFSRETQMGGGTDVTERRKTDILGSIEFNQRQLGVATPKEIELEGTGPYADLWNAALSREMGIPVVARDTARELGLKVGEWGAYASVGAALRCLAPGPIKLNLDPSDQEREDDLRVASTVFVMGSVVAAFLLCVSGLRAVLAMQKSHQLGRLSDVARIEAFLNKTPAQINQLLQDMQRRADSLVTLATSRSRVVEILEDLAESVPERVWLTSISYSNPISGELARAAQRLQLGGRVAGFDAAQEQDIAIQFREKLHNHPRFGKMFACGGASVQSRSEGAAAAGLGKEEGFTNFSFECVSKR
ncbi:MAG: hypothetical protein HY551_05980 [Elusimicrobia bacterium]|nr:hypothetical protein [Elusimicrobiota bacterium]